MRRPPTPRPAETVRSDSRERILCAARQLFSVEGYERTTIRSVAEQCGLTDAAVLYHFKSKQGLLEALLIEPESPPVHVADEWEPEAFADELTEVFLAWAENADLMRLVYAEAMAGENLTTTFWDKAERGYRDMIRPALARHCGESAEHIARTLSIVLNGLYMDGLIRYAKDFPRAANEPAFRETIRQCCLLALPPPTAAARAVSA